MAWELQSGSEYRVRMSVFRHALNQDNTKGWLAGMRADQQWSEGDNYDALHYDALLREALTQGIPELVIAIANHAVETVAATTNGGHEIYLDDWTTIPWASDEFINDCASFL